MPGHEDEEDDEDEEGAIAKVWHEVGELLGLILRQLWGFQLLLWAVSPFLFSRWGGVFHALAGVGALVSTITHI